MRSPFVIGALLLVALAPIALSQEGDGTEPVMLEATTAPTEAPGRAQVSVDVFLKDSTCGASTFCIWFAANQPDIVLPPGAEVTFNVWNIGGAEHDFTLGPGATAVDAADERPREDGVGPAVKTPLLGAGGNYALKAIMPESGTIEYVCSIAGHAALGMVGSIQVGGAAAVEEKHIEDYGVNYWAYWVGVISFVILFIVLAVLYFVFRYGETKETVDQRTGVTDKRVAASGGVAHAHESPLSMWIALLVAVVFTLILIIAVIIGGG